jgi:hypothetical protein
MPTTTSPPKSRVQLEAENLLREAAKSTGPLPLDYGHPEPFHQTVSNNSNAFADHLGGWRQLGFALGLASTLGGLGYCVARNFSQQDGAFWMAAGGLLIGFAIPLNKQKPQ